MYHVVVWFFFFSELLMVCRLFFFCFYFEISPYTNIFRRVLHNTFVGIFGNVTVAIAAPVAVVVVVVVVIFFRLLMVNRIHATHKQMTTTVYFKTEFKKKKKSANNKERTKCHLCQVNPKMFTTSMWDRDRCRLECCPHRIHSHQIYIRKIHVEGVHCERTCTVQINSPTNNKIKKKKKTTHIYSQHLSTVWLSEWASDEKENV